MDFNSTGQCPGAKQAAEKGHVFGVEIEEHTSGAEAHIDLIGFMPGINPRPTARTSFSAARKAPFLSFNLAYGTTEVEPLHTSTFSWRFSSVKSSPFKHLRSNYSYSETGGDLAGAASSGEEAAALLRWGLARGGV